MSVRQLFIWVKEWAIGTLFILLVVWAVSDVDFIVLEEKWERIFILFKRKAGEKVLSVHDCMNEYWLGEVKTNDD